LIGLITKTASENFILYSHETFSLSSMALIFGQIESTKTLRKELDFRNISMFNSIREIEDFKRNYESIKEEILAQARVNFQKEIAQKSSELEKSESELKAQVGKEEAEVKFNINRLESKVSDLNERLKVQNFLRRLFITISRWQQEYKLRQLRTNGDQIIIKRTSLIRQKVNNLHSHIDYLTQNSEKIITERCENELSELNRTKKAISDLRTIIAGARGESAVEQELKKLPDNFYVINDFRLNFSRPIINKQTGDKIFSIQIDHLVISPGGVFLLETKNWSNRSIKSLNLRSPIEQIRRSSYALFVFINNKISINTHHWGSKQISLKSILVMVGATTNQKFQFVKVKELRDLNRYLKYFDPIFTDAETKWLANTLLDYCD